jgi:hypothetical protein
VKSPDFVNDAIKSHRAMFIMGILSIYLGMFFSAGLAQTLLWNRITRDVNQRIGDGEKYSTSMWAVRRSAHGEINQFKIWHLHRRFLPDSYLRLSFSAALVLTIAWMFFGLSILGALVPN